MQLVMRLSSRLAQLSHSVLIRVPALCCLADLPLAAFISAAAPPNRKCPHPQCGDGAPLHLRSFMHGNGLVTLSSVRLPAGKELPEGRVWMWLRVIAAANGAEGAAAARRVPLSSEAACLSFAHLLSLLLDARHLSLGGMSLQRDFVRYLGSGSTLLCLHYSPAPPYIVNMPPRQVELLPEMEDEWLQEEIKQLTEVGGWAGGVDWCCGWLAACCAVFVCTSAPIMVPCLLQEADEAFGAIEYALGEQLRVLEGSAEPEPEFAQMWLDTLADTRATFLDTVGWWADHAGGPVLQEAVFGFASHLAVKVVSGRLSAALRHSCLGCCRSRTQLLN